MANDLPVFKKKVRKNIFKKGGLIKDMWELDQWLSKDGWVYLQTSDRPKHPAVLMAMTYRTVEQYVKRGCLFKAERQQKELVSTETV